VVQSRRKILRQLSYHLEHHGFMKPATLAPVMESVPPDSCSPRLPLRHPPLTTDHCGLLQVCVCCVQTVTTHCWPFPAAVSDMCRLST